MRKNLRIETPKNRRKMVGGSGEISPLPPTIFVMITNQKWQLYPKDNYADYQNEMMGYSHCFYTDVSDYNSKHPESSPDA